MPLPIHLRNKEQEEKARQDARNSRDTFDKKVLEAKEGSYYLSQTNLNSIQIKALGEQITFIQEQRKFLSLQSEFNKSQRRYFIATVTLTFVMAAATIVMALATWQIANK